MIHTGAHDVIYDGQCEICQAGVSWLKALDGKNHLVVCHPIDPQTLASIHKDLRIEDCLRELHVVKPNGEIVVGWDAVATLARLFPATWIIGALGVVPGLRGLFAAFYRVVARNRYALSKCRGGACHVDPARGFPQEVQACRVLELLH